MRTAPALIALVCLLLVTGCQKDHERLRKQTTAKMNEAVQILKTVTDEPTAKAAAPKLQAVADDMKRLQQEMNHLGEADKDVKKHRGDQYGKDFLDASRGLADEIERIRAMPAANAALDSALQQMNWNRLEK